ncbi:hypothetical protein ACNUDN_09445 [Mycobacterium sp. smrl_JER01]|uniref:hypothetical protein n=1 Tax=Mycobacterium sp. smrl_JER01 TaxID=3402633 RepID=UPI003AC30CA1
MANKRRITLCCEPEWDDEVDVICTDSGLGGLATAIATVEQDGEVFVADRSDPRTDLRTEASGAATPATLGSAGGWLRVGSDAHTAEYFRELTADLDLDALRHTDPDLPVHLMGATAPVRGRTVPPFEGARLRDWAARCVPSPSGYLYTRVTDWTAATRSDGDGTLFKVTEVGALTPDPDDPVGSVLAWLESEADSRDIHRNPVTRFERLIFQDGQVIGAVFATEDGPVWVRARHGVLICRGRAAGRGAALPGLRAGTPLRIALVGTEASRFGRVELLTSDSSVVEAIGRPASQHTAGAVTTWRN